MTYYLIYDVDGKEPLCVIGLALKFDEGMGEAFRGIASRMATLTKRAGIKSTDLTFKEVQQAEAETIAEIADLPLIIES